MSWDDAVLVWNGMAAGVPALVVQPGSAEEVEAAVAFAQEHGLELRIKGEGDSSGAALAERCVTLDLSRLRGD